MPTAPLALGPYENPHTARSFVSRNKVPMSAANARLSIQGVSTHSLFIIRRSKAVIPDGKLVVSAYRTKLYPSIIRNGTDTGYFH